jgi:branched-chain amino acid transport system ATP-binding protein
MLSVENINVYYGSIHAVKDVSFEVRRGEIVTLIGANGAGKSTILKTVSGLLRSRTGRITFLGEDVAAADAHKLTHMGLAHVPEGRRIFQQMTVRENLDMGGYIKNKEENRLARAEIYKRFPRVRERKNQIAGTLSGGEQQMLALGRSLMSAPKLIMMDEPSMGLAPVLVNLIFDIITELNQAGATILLVEQNARMALSVAHRCYVLETGKIVMASDARELLSNDEVKKAYLGG